MGIANRSGGDGSPAHPGGQREGEAHPLNQAGLSPAAFTASLFCALAF